MIIVSSMKTENKNINTFSEHLDKRYGKVGTQTRTNFEAKAIDFAFSELKIQTDAKILNANTEK